MEKILEIQRSKVNGVYEILEKLLLNLEWISDFDKESVENIIDKLRLLNKDLEIVKDRAMDILIDIDNKESILDDDLKNRLEEEKKTNENIKKISPFLLYFLMIQNSMPKNLEDP